MRPILAATALLVLQADAPVAGTREPAPSALAAFGFMAGCWRGPSGDGAVIEEYYTTPSENLILGLTRYTKDGLVTGYEFTTLAREDTTIVLTPHPSGQRAAPFRLTRVDSTQAVWENPAHDFPTLIAYRRGCRRQSPGAHRGTGRERPPLDRVADGSRHLRGVKAPGPRRRGRRSRR